jgi:hypothetical protein
MQYVKGKSDLVDKDGVLTVPASALGLTGPHDMKTRFSKMGYKSGSMIVLFSKGAAGIAPAPPKDELVISVVHPNTGTKELDFDERNDEFDTAKDVADAVKNLKVGAGRRRKTRRKTGRKTKKSKKSRRAL